MYVSALYLRRQRPIPRGSDGDFAPHLSPPSNCVGRNDIGVGNIWGGSLEINFLPNKPHFLRSYNYLSFLLNVVHVSLWDIVALLCKTNITRPMHETPG